MSDTSFVRFQSPTVGPEGRRSGVFALVNGLSFEGRLTPGQERWRRRNNAWFERHLPNPGVISPAIYDRTVNPRAAAWFKPTATVMLERTRGYLDLLTLHGVAWEEARVVDPGRLVYEDRYQIVVVHDPLASPGPTARLREPPPSPRQFAL